MFFDAVGLLRFVCPIYIVSYNIEPSIEFFPMNYRLYQIRVGLRVSPKVPVHIEASVSSSNGGARAGRPAANAALIGGLAASRPFQIMYRNEEVTLRDIVHFRAHLLGK